MSDNRTREGVNKKGLGFLGVAYISLAILYSGGGWLMPKLTNGQNETKSRKFFRKWGKRLPLVGGMFVSLYYSSVHVIKPAAELIFEHMLKPIGRGISATVRGIGRGIKTVSLFTYNKILEPIGSGVVKACNFSIRCVVKTAEAVKNGVAWTIKGYDSANAAYDDTGQKVKWYQDNSKKVNVKKAVWYITKTIYTVGGPLVFRAPAKLEGDKQYLNNDENRKEPKFRKICRKIANHMPLGGIFASVIYVPVLASKKLHDYGWNAVETQNFLTAGRKVRITIRNRFIDLLNFHSEKSWKFKCWRNEKSIEFRKWRTEIRQNFREWRDSVTNRGNTVIPTPNEAREETTSFLQDQPTSNIHRPIPKAHKDLYTREEAAKCIARILLGILKNEHNRKTNKITRRKHLTKSGSKLNKNQIVLSAIGDDGEINAVRDNPSIDDNKVNLFISEEARKLSIEAENTTDSYKNIKQHLKKIIKGELKITNITELSNYSAVAK